MNFKLVAGAAAVAIALVACGDSSQKKADELVANFQSYLKDINKQDAYKWESATPIDGGVRLNNVIFDENEGKLKALNLYQFENTADKVTYKVSFEGASNAKTGKSLFQDIWEEDGTYETLGLEGDLPLINGDLEGFHDKKANKAAGTFAFEQPTILSFKFAYDLNNVNTMIDKINQDKDASLFRNEDQLLAVFAPVTLSKLEFSVKDIGFINHLKKNENFEVPDVNECKALASAFGFGDYASACDVAVDFIAGKSDSVSVKLNPSEAVPFTAFAIAAQAGQAETLQFLKTLNLQITK